MTVAEMIEWLKTQDQEAIVQVVRHESGRGYYDQGGNTSIVDFDITDDNLMTYTNFRCNSTVKPDDDLYNKRYLLLGEKDG